MSDWSLLLLLVPALFSFLSLYGLSLLPYTRPLGALAAGAMAGAALLMITPETITFQSLFWLACGFTSMFLVDHFLHPLCSKQGNPWPLWISLAVHFGLDGALTSAASSDSLATASFFLHRVPEAVGLPMLLRSGHSRPASLPFVIASLYTFSLLGYSFAGNLHSLRLDQFFPFLGGAILFLAAHSFHRCMSVTPLHWGHSLLGLLGVFAARFTFLHFSHSH